MAEHTIDLNTVVERGFRVMAEVLDSYRPGYEKIAKGDKLDHHDIDAIRQTAKSAVKQNEKSDAK